MTTPLRIASGFAVLLALAALSRATETEHLGLRVLPAPGAMKVDGKADDWDLTGGVFACGDVENARDRFAVWIHAMHDREALYLLARFVDETPLNNPGSVKGDYGFAGDSLQVRIITAADTKQERTSHWTCWRDREGLDLMDVAYGKQFNEGNVKDARSQGASQAFLRNPDGKGYAHELAIPWKLIAREGVTPKAGDPMRMTVEPNFTLGTNGRLSVKDIFRAGVAIDRVFTFMGSTCWGVATLEAKGGLKPGPVRLSDGREFPVRMEGGVPAVDWTGLIKSRERLGFKPVRFAMPEDGYVSIVIRGPDGAVVRSLLSADFFSKGEHEVKWDGLTTPSVKKPGEPVPAGDYTWSGIWHRGLGLRLRGWACNSGNAPWDGATGKENWGGDHGLPAACAADGEKVYLGWSGAEAGKALLACDREGNVLWKNIRGGIAGAAPLAVDGGTVYAYNDVGGFAAKGIYRVDTKAGAYTEWTSTRSTDLLIKDLWGGEKGKPEKPDALAARGGRVYVGFTPANAVVVVDGATGKVLKTLSVPAPGDIEPAADGSLFVISGGKGVVIVDPEGGTSRPFIDGLSKASALALDREGCLYVGMGEPDNRVVVFGPDGKPRKTIGRKGGRAKLGRWTPEGMLHVAGMAVDAGGRLWVMEADSAPKRVSVWDAGSGALHKEFFGPTSYGALGGAIHPQDPDLMAGQGCEWRLDPKTGQAACLGTITRDGMECARFGLGEKNRVYLAVASNWAFNVAPLKIYERVGDADYKLRTVIYYVDKEGKEIAPTGHGQTGKSAKTVCWADANGDGQRQPEETASSAEGELKFSGWYMGMTPEMALYSGDRQFKVAGFSPCGAPLYDLSRPVRMPAPGLGSADGRLVLQSGEYGVEHGLYRCYDIAAGKLLWTYPDNFVGVHGSHKACPPETGMIRGSFGPCGAVKLSEPVGNAWVIATNVGEWHLLTEKGYYLSRLFEGDPTKVSWPEKGGPGVPIDACPPGLGGEDFGGSVALGADGKLYLQAGKTAFWNVEVTGLDAVKPLPVGGRVSITEEDVKASAEFKGRYLQMAAGVRRWTLKKATPAFTGDLDKDFTGAEGVSFKKQDAAAVRVAAAWDNANLYVGWEVKDETPWVNGADALEFLYARGDTVDLQIGTDPKADLKRAEAVAGDLRLSVGPYQGRPAAVVFRKVSSEKRPKTFRSGVVKEYVMDFVGEVKEARVEVKVDAKSRRYVVEAAVPLEALGLRLSPGLSLRADVGVTHGDKAGKDTAMRTYWSNQSTGIVNDEVFELQMEPRNWGDWRIGD
jgi:hypothetical protein